MSRSQAAFDFDSAVLEVLPRDVSHAISTLAQSENVNSRGAVFTRVEVVDFVLDLVGYTADRPLSEMRLLEPSCGAGDFLLPAVERLLASWREMEASDLPEATLREAIRAVELHADSAGQTRGLVQAKLVAEGLDVAAAAALADAWIIEGDFLLTSLPGPFDFVVGNPPYVRQELIPDALLRQYRQRYETMYDRADIYVPFIEKSLDLLSEWGKLGFICSDRWMKNKYGGPLRKKVSKNFSLQVHVDMVDTDAFLHEVSAYPAITVIGRGKQGITRIAYRPEVTKTGLSALSSALAGRGNGSRNLVREVEGVAKGSEPWLLEQPELIPLVRRMETAYPTMEEAGCRVGIGVATGADKAYVSLFDLLDVEPDRKLRLATTSDLVDGRVEWKGMGVINPFESSGGLVDLQAYPKLAKYLDDRREVIARRQCARRNPMRWYRTIDRITPSLAAKPKLLIPDIKGSATVVYEPGRLYPHHNLYFITSETWDVEALQAVLLSGLAHLFVSVYSTRMRGGYLRFQAQYLRRIRIPEWRHVTEPLRARLHEAARELDIQACSRATADLYGLSMVEAALLQKQTESE